MEEDPENGKESSHSARVNGMNEFTSRTGSLIVSLRVCGFLCGIYVFDPNAANCCPYLCSKQHLELLLHLGSDDHPIKITWCKTRRIRSSKVVGIDSLSKAEANKSWAPGHHGD